jgi:hypothetical protein
MIRAELAVAAIALIASGAVATFQRDHGQL